MSRFVVSRSSRARVRTVIVRAIAPLVAAGANAPAIGVAAADMAHTGCNSVTVGQSSGWCGLYPGNAVENVQELGIVSVSADGRSITIQTRDAYTGVVPSTSFACLTLTPASQIMHRLQGQQCAQAGGVWFPISGGAQAIDLSAYPQFLNAQLTVQVAANHDANNSNGDAFYNNVSVNTTVSTGGNA